MDEGTFEVEIGPLGPKRVVVNGEDITPEVRAMSLFSAPGQPSILQLEIMGSGPASGQGIIQLKPSEPSMDSIVRRIRSLKPEEIDKEAMEKLGWGDDSSLTSVILQIISEKLSGH